MTETSAPQPERINRADRDALLSLVRKRERVMKSEAEKRSAEMLADFDAQLAKIWSWDDDEVWAKAKEAVEAAAQEANDKIAARCKELGIPDEFAPSIGWGWRGGNQQAMRERREVLRRAARSRIAAIEKAAVKEIELVALDAQQELLTLSLATVANKFLGEMKPIAKLMPMLDATAVADLIAVNTTKGPRRLGYDEDVGGRFN